MNNEIIPEVTPDMETLKNALAKELPAGHKIKIPPLNRKVQRVIKSFGVETVVIVKKSEKVLIQNRYPMMIGLYIFLFLPLGIYLMFKKKESERLESSVHDIVFRATRR